MIIIFEKMNIIIFSTPQPHVSSHVLVFHKASFMKFMKYIYMIFVNMLIN